MSSKSEEETKIKFEEKNPIELKESETQKKRSKGILKEQEGTRKEEIKKEDDKKEEIKKEEIKIIKKIPFFIKFISFLHILLVGILFTLSIHFYNEFISMKRSEEIDVESGMRITKSIGCILLGVFLAYTRAVLLSNFY